MDIDTTIVHEEAVERLGQDIEEAKKLTKDLKEAVLTMTPHEVRFLVDSYYQMQANRIRADGQIRSMSAEPHKVLQWLSTNSIFLETQIKNALSHYSNNHPVGEWSRTVVGIGPVIASGLLAHIDITKAPTAGHIWSFAGISPLSKWEKGEKRPWNASLKTLCWKIGESFVKVSGKENAFYGKMYLERKAIEIQNNDAGKFADQAKEAAMRVGKTTEAYKHYSTGKLPPGHIHARAKRWAVKQFLSDWHAKAYREHYKTDPPAPYAQAILGHAHIRKL